MLIRAAAVAARRRGASSPAGNETELVFTTGTLPTDVTLTRSTTATYVNSSGLIATAAINAARYDYDPVTLTIRGLLIEEARTNLQHRSSILTNTTSWPNNATTNGTTGTGVTPVRTALTDLACPNGALNEATSLLFDLGAGYTNSTNKSGIVGLSIASAGTYTVSIYWKVIAGDATGLRFNFGGSSPTTTDVDAGNGWFRRIYTATSASAQLPRLGVEGHAARTTQTCTIAFWGAQVEAGATATSHIVTPANATITRAADIVSAAASVIDYSATEGMFQVDFIPTAIDRRILQVDDGTANNRMFLATSTTGVRFQVDNGGVNDVQIDAGTITMGSINSLVASYAANDFSLRANGGTEVTDVTGAVPAATTLRIGSDAASTTQFNGHIRTITYTTGEPAPSGVEITTHSGQLRSTANNQTIQNKDVYFTHADYLLTPEATADTNAGRNTLWSGAVFISHNFVTLKNCRIRHAGFQGIKITGDNCIIEDCEIINVGAPDGITPESGTLKRNIWAEGAADLIIRRCTFREGSSGIYAENCDRLNASFCDGYNFRGGYPRGQFFQTTASDDCVLTDFYAYNDPNDSWPEDIINFGQNSSGSPSLRARCERGVIDGNNSKSGVGVMFEDGAVGGRVYDVDCIHQGNGDFSCYARDIWYIRCRSFDHMPYIDQGRGLPLSGPTRQLWFISSLAIGTTKPTGIRIEDCTWTRRNGAGPAGFENLSLADVCEISEDVNAVPRTPHINVWNWIVV